MRKLLLILWMIFAVTVIYMFAVGAFFIGKKVPDRIWMPDPRILLVFCLVLVFWTLGLLLSIGIRRFAGRIGN